MKNMFNLKLNYNIIWQSKEAKKSTVAALLALDTLGEYVLCCHHIVVAAPNVVTSVFF